MALYLVEILPTETGAEKVPALLDEIVRTVDSVGAEVIEFQVAEDRARVFSVIETAAQQVDSLREAVERIIGSTGRLRGPDLVRLVGADLEEVRSARPRDGFLVEWDLPADLGMDGYLTRKAANAPRYAEVPEVRFLRTYVREDMAKCLCLYDAPDEALVRKARAAVEAPVDRLHAIRRPERDTS